MSRRLDARVADIVMGLETSRLDAFGDEVSLVFQLPDYSTYLNAAFEVVRELTSQDFRVQTNSYNRVEVTRVRIYTRSRELIADIVEIKLPTAICLAALRAKGDGDWVDNYLKEMK